MKSIQLAVYPPSVKVRGNDKRLDFDTNLN